MKPPDNEINKTAGTAAEGGAGAAGAGATQGAGTGAGTAGAGAGAGGNTATQGAGAGGNTATQGTGTAGGGAAGARELAEGEEPKPKELITLTTEALAARTSRASRAFLREQFGTDDPATVKEKLKKLEDLEKEGDERRRAQLSEIERLKEDNQRLTVRASNAEMRAHELEEAQALAGDEAELKSVASEYVKEKYWKVVMPELAEHLGDTYTTEQLDAMNGAERDKVVRSFFEKYAKDNPELAKAAGANGGGGNAGAAGGGGQAGGQAGGEVPTVKKSLVTGGPNPRGKGDPKPPPVITSGPFAGKTAAPGHPNSMTKAEFAEWKKQTGNTY